ncbi:MAG: HNH endonuclease [Acidimicrobiia bacterium]
MKTIVLTWNPNLWEMSEKELKSLAKRSRSGKLRSKGGWSTGVRKSGVVSGDRCFLLRQSTERGLIASGTFTSEIYQDDHWDGTPGKTANYADVVWTKWLSTSDRLPVEDLVLEVPGFHWNQVQSSGQEVPVAVAEVLERVWAAHAGAEPFRSPEEQEVFSEGEAVRVEVNRYERNAEARRRCLDYYGTVCSVCALDFEARYGAIGRGFIHVHHVRDIAQVGKAYEVDPIKDLRPVCPNCHAMLHKTVPAMSVGSLKKRLR